MKSHSSAGRRSLLVALSLGAPVWSWAQAAPGAGPAPSLTVPDVAPSTPEAVLPGLEIPYAPNLPDRASNTNARQALDDGRVALHAGLPTAAGDRFREGLALPGVSSDLRDALNLNLITSDLALGRYDDAASALKQVQDASAPPVILRAALLDVHTQKWTEAAAQLARLTLEQLPDEDRPWFYAVKAQLAEQDKNVDAAEAAWSKASDLATVPFQQDEFQAAWWRAKTFLGEPATTSDLENLEKQLSQDVDKYRNQSLGVQYALHDAVVLDKLGRHADALKLITQLQLAMSDDNPEVRDANDQVRLLLAVLDEEDPASNSDPQRDRLALQKVLQSHGSQLTADERQAQEIALALLERNYQQDLEGLRHFVDAMIADPLEKDNPFLDDFYLMQARLALSQNQLEQASSSAKLLKDRFPASHLHEDAIRMLAYIAFKSTPPQYRSAADYLSQLLDDPQMSDLSKRAVREQIADLYFLNHDYRNSADSYKALLTSLPQGSPGGTLLFYAVESELRDGQHEKDGPVDADHLSTAVAILDDANVREKVAPVDRWPAEWNVLSAMRDNGPAGDALAFDRLGRLLDQGSTGDAAPKDLDLRLRLLWLDARLAVDVSDATAPKKAAALQDAVNAVPETGAPNVSADLRQQLAATALLLRGQAASQNNQSAEEAEFFKDLRDNPLLLKSDAAAFSRIFEAHALAAQGKYVPAEALMKQVYEPDQMYFNLKYAPLAMYEAAGYAIEQGSSQYDDALNILVKFAGLYPQHELLYHVRMLLAYIKDKQYDFKSALDLYQILLTDPNHPLSPQIRTQVKMATASCLATEASITNDSKTRQAALDELEGLANSKDLAPEASVEVADEYGYLLAHGDEQGNGRDLVAAAKVFMVPITKFSQDPAYAVELQRSVNGPFWLSKCLFDLAEIYEQQEHPSRDDEARSLYGLVKLYNLPGAKVAQEYLDKPPAPNPATSTPAEPSPPPPGASAGPAIPAI